MPEYQDENEEIKDLLKKKAKLSKDSQRQSDLGDVLFRIGYLYYHKGYYTEALAEFEHALEVRKKLSVSIDIATTHRFVGETLCKLGNDYERAKKELNMYYSVTLRLKDLVEIQRAETTLGNYYMALYESNYQNNKKTHLNEAYSYYLKSYDILNEISEKRLVDSKEFGLMKARTCHNCAFAMDEKRDLIICNEYLKTAIEICEKNHFYEDLIRCYYIKIDQAKRKNKMEETLRLTDKLIEITCKSKDHVQQSSDFFFVAEIYLKIQNFDKAKSLLRKAYKLRKKCLINPEITLKLKSVINVIQLQRDLNSFDLNEAISGINIDLEKSLKVLKIYEKLGDSLCNLSLYESGLIHYQKQLELARKLNRPNTELALIYASLAQTCQDLDDLKQSLEYYDLEIKANVMDSESVCKSLLNIAVIKEKLTVEFAELKDVYMKAYQKAKEIVNIETSLKLQLKAMNLLKETQTSYSVENSETQKIINSLNEIKKIRNMSSIDDDEASKSDRESEQQDEDNEDDNDESIIFSSESEEEEITEEQDIKITNKSKLKPKKYVVKLSKRMDYYQRKHTVVLIKKVKDLRGETHLHVACIKGNFKMAKKLLEEGHPANERDNLNWLPIHEACNYGHVELVELLIKHGAKVNDHIGPITPIHDAAQNGHFEVVRVLLKAGAIPYVFSQEGYTPLDYLCHYKENNVDKMTSHDLELYKEIFEMMLSNIRSRDKLYKIKKITNTEDNFVVENDSESMESTENFSKPKTSSTSECEFSTKTRLNKKNAANYGLDDLSDRNSESESEEIPKLKKKKAVNEYKAAMNCFGSKSSVGSSASCGSSKKAIDKVVITEAEYNNVNDWLINDMEKKQSSSTKRKLKENYDEPCNIDDDLSNLTFEDIEENNNTDEEYIDEIMSHNAKSKKLQAKKNEVINSPISKRRNIDTFSGNADITNRQCDLFEENDSQSSSSSVVLANFNNIRNEPKSIFKKSKENLRSFEILIDSNRDENFTNKENDFKIKSPLKKNKTQLKLTKMLNHNYSKQTALKEPTPAVEIIENRNTEKIKPPIVEKEITKASWKIKATIDNRNFLIPVSNIFATINDLTIQIVTRYKTIFSNDPLYKEPEKVILKSSDDLILFGEDLIKDVLADQSQVKLMIESYKGAPVVNELYEKLCLENNLTVYSNIEQSLKESENFLNLNSISIDQKNMTKQFDVIFESIKLISKQQLALKNFSVNLNKIDISNNLINDQTAICFIETVIPECINLKHLNLGFNQLTVKTLKAFCDLTTSNKLSKPIPIEYLIMSGNDIGSSNSKCDLILILNNLITLFHSLKSINFSDCKININDSNSNESFNDNSWKRLLNTIKTSKLTEVDFSYNTFSLKCFSDLIESLPDFQIEILNLSNCITKKNKSSESIDYLSSLNKFLGSTLRSLSLRNMNLNIDQSSTLINRLSNSCKQLKYIDLSYNSFEFFSVECLFTECLKIEEAYLINNENTYMNWTELTRMKFEETNSAPLKHFEIKLTDRKEKNNITNFFKGKWQNNFVKTIYTPKNIIEIKVDYV